MLKVLIQKSDFKALSQFVSLNFFSVVPIGECLMAVSRVLLDARSSEKCAKARDRVQPFLTPLGVKIVNTVTAKPVSLAGS